MLLIMIQTVQRVQLETGNFVTCPLIFPKILVKSNEDIVNKMLKSRVMLDCHGIANIEK